VRGFGGVFFGLRRFSRNIDIAVYFHETATAQTRRVSLVNCWVVGKHDVGNIGCLDYFGWTRNNDGQAKRGGYFIYYGHFGILFTFVLNVNTNVKTQFFSNAYAT
jgi:hypothetical protein